MLSSKIDIVQAENIEPLAQYPGFVKVLLSSDTNEYLKASKLNEGMPRKIEYVVKILTKWFSENKNYEISLEYKRLCAAHKLECSNNLQPLQMQLQQSRGNEIQRTFLENFVRICLKQTNISDLGSFITEALSIFDRASDMKDAFNLVGKLLMSVKDELIDPTNKCKETYSPKECSDLSNAGCEFPQVETKDTKNPEDKGKLVQRRVEQSKGQEFSSIETQQKSIETDVKNISEPSGNSNISDPTIQEKIENCIFQYYCDAALNLSVSSSLIPDSTDDPKKVKLFPSEETNESKKNLPRKSGLDLVMSKKLNKWPNNAKYWFDKDRQKKSKLGRDTLTLINESYIYIVAKHPEAMQKSEEIEYTFRMSFSHPEKLLCNAMNKIQLKSYRLMKALHITKFKKCVERFCSYHIKTTIFWAMEKNEIDFWTAENLELCVALLLINLLDAIKYKYLEHFFIQGLNLFENFTAEELEKLKDEINKVLQDLTSAFQNIIDISESKSKIIYEQTHSSSDTAASLVLDHITPITFEAWSKKYDEMVVELLTEVSPSSSMLSPSRFSEKLRSTIQNAIKQEIMTIENFYQIFEEVKPGLFQKHCFIVKDMKRPLSIVILEAIENFECFLNYIFSLNEEGMTVESGTQKALEGIINSDPEAMRALGAVSPNLSDLLQSLTQILYNS